MRGATHPYRRAPRWLLASCLVVAACSHARPADTPLPESRGVLRTADAAALAYRTIGAGPDTVVVVHGFQGNGHGYLGPDLEPLASRGRVLVFYDQRGDGHSGPVADPATLALDTHVDDLEALRRELGLGRLTLLAHSGGAAIAIRYAERHPGRVARLALVAPLPPARDPFAAATMRAFAPRLDSAVRARATALQATLPTATDPAAVCRAVAAAVVPRAYFADPRAAARMRGDFCAGRPEALRTQPARLAAFQRSLPADWRPIARQVRAPTLVVHGDRDAIPVVAAEAWVQALPSARLLVIADADHLPWVERPERFFSAVSDFLAGVASSPPAH